MVGAAATAVLFLAIYPARGLGTPLGFDTARYLWRNHCVEAGGLDALEDCRPPLSSSLPGRPGYPSVTLPFASLLGGDGATSAALPGALAAVIGLAAGSLVTRMTGRGPILLALTAFVVGSSVMVARLAGPEGYADNMIALALGLSGMALAVLPESSGRIAAGVLLGTSALVHWPTALLVAAVLVGTALTGIRGRTGVDLRLPARVGAVLVLALGVWGAAVIVLGAGPEPFFADPLSLRAKVRSDLAAYSLPITIPLAAIGALLLQSRERDERPLERLLLVWIGLIAAATVVWIAVPVIPRSLRGVGPGVPLHRVLAFALPLPILTAIGLAALPSWLTRVHRAALWGLILAGVAVSAGVGARLWWRNEPFLDAATLREASLAAAYLEVEVPADHAVIVPFDRVAGNPTLDAYRAVDTFRVAMPPDRIDDVVLYLGDAARLREAKPTLTGDPAFDSASLFRWPAVRRALDRPNVIFVLRSLSTAFDSAEPTTAVVGPGVLVAGGEAPAIPFTQGATPGLVEPAAVPFAGAGLLVTLGLVGAGWSAANRNRTFERVALAPAFGIAATLAASLVADAAGVGIAGASGALVAAAAGILGGLAWFVRRRPKERSTIRPPGISAVGRGGPVE